MRARTVKKNRHGATFFGRLRSAWMVLCGKIPPGFNALPYENVEVRLTTKTPIHVQAAWWARDGEPVEVAKDAIAHEFMKAVRPNIKYTVEPCEDGQGKIVRGELWILEGEHHGEAENKS